MSLTAAIWWAIVAAWLVVAILIVAQFVAIGRQLLRAVKRVGGYGDLPVVAAIERAATNAERLAALPARLEPLPERSRAALAVIARGPFPPEIVTAFVWLRTEYAAYRAVARR